MSAAEMKAFKEDLEDNSASKGAIRLPLHAPPAATLVRGLVKARREENEAAAKGGQR